MNGDGHISLEDLQVFSRDPTARLFFELNNIGIRDVRVWFRGLLAESGKSRLEIKSLVKACMKVKGNATSLEAQVMMGQMAALTQSLELIRNQLGVAPRPLEARQQIMAGDALPSGSEARSQLF